MTKDSAAALSTDELLKIRGELAYAAMMSAAEALPLADETKREMTLVHDELTKRGVNVDAKR